MRLDNAETYDTENGIEIVGTPSRFDVATWSVGTQGLCSVLHGRFAPMNRERPIARIRVIAIAEYEERL